MNPKFLDAVRDVLAENNMAKKTEMTLGSDLSFAVARGAADLQRRRQQGWLGCEQPKYCN